MDNDNDKIASMNELVFGSSTVTFTERFNDIVVGPRHLQELADTSALVSSFRSIGIQASKLHEATEIINEMLKLRAESVKQDNDYNAHIKHADRCLKGCTIFLGFTSNMMSSGIREIFCNIVKNDMVDCIVTTAGGIEEDFIKCLDDFRIGDFTLDGSSLRQDHINRIGNIMAPNSAYCKFENWLTPILDYMLNEQIKYHVSWTPSKLIRLLGERINDQRSVYYWAFKNQIPVFCPAITDGSLGDIIYKSEEKLRMDVIEDQVELNNIAVYARRTGMIILGGGVTKHQICNANLMRNGADFCVFVNTGIEHDASDSGASIDEAKSWGKVKVDARSVKVFCDASIAFPLIAASTFFKSK